VKIAQALDVQGQDEVLAAMRAATWQDVLSAAAGDDTGFRANLVVDGHVLPDSVHTIFSEGRAPMRIWVSLSPLSVGMFTSMSTRSTSRRRA